MPTKKELFFISLFSIFFFVGIAKADDHNLQILLKKYVKESKLSKKTKKDVSGLLYLYTREMLDKMQAKNLRDVLKTVPQINLYLNLINIPTISISSYGEFPSGAVRILINDHDISSTTYGSGFLNWGDIDLDYIDHIEIYKGTSSIRFGSEIAHIVIKLYTKLASREVGSKIRVMVDGKGSSILNLYNANVINDDLSYFIFGNLRDINNDKHYKQFMGKRYVYDRDNKEYNFYTNVEYHKWLFEIGAMNKKSGGFIDVGLFQTPNGSNMNVKHKYFQLSKTFLNNYKVKVSVDSIEQSRNSIDPNLLNVHGIFVTNYSSQAKDDIYSFTLDKMTYLGDKDTLLLGGFYKYKTMNIKGDMFNSKNSSIFYNNKIKNSIKYYALYGEYTHKFSKNISFITLAKQEYQRYQKDIKGFDKLYYKFALEYKDSKFLSRLSYTKSFVPVQPYQIVYPLRVPYKVNSKISIPDNEIILFTNRYKFDNSYIKFVLGRTTAKNPIFYNPINPDGYANIYGFKSRNRIFELSYHYDFDGDNNFDITFHDSKSNLPKLFSPKYGVIARVFNSFDKFDLYNELVYKSPYKSFGIEIKDSYDWTSAIKYHFSKDLSIGVRGENILKKGLKQAYRGISYPIALVEQKFWLNIEYLF